MKVLIATSIYPPDIGGPATYVPIIAKALVEKNFYVKVITFSDIKYYALDYNKYEIYRILRKNKITKHFHYMKCLYKLIKWADVIYVNSMSLLPHIYIVNLIYKKPVILKFVGDWLWERLFDRGLINESYEEFLKKEYTIWIEILKKLRFTILKKVDRIIVPSKFLKNTLIQSGINREKIEVIYNAIDNKHGKIEDHNSQDLKIPKHFYEDFTIITASRLVPWKNIRGIIDVLYKLPPHVKLIIIGDGPERKKLESRVKSLGLQERVYFSGAVDRTTLFTLFKIGNLFVLNSLYEGLPHIVIEALYSGLPVIATNVGGTPEVVKDGKTGFLISPNDNKALYNAVKKFLDNPELLEKMPDKEEVDKLRRNFSYENMINKTISVIKSV